MQTCLKNHIEVTKIERADVVECNERYCTSSERILCLVHDSVIEVHDHKALAKQLHYQRDIYCSVDITCWLSTDQLSYRERTRAIHETTSSCHQFLIERKHSNENNLSNGTLNWYTVSLIETYVYHAWLCFKLLRWAFL